MQSAALFVLDRHITSLFFRYANRLGRPAYNLQQ
ncbi:hypothetical protein X759_27255 [Mesorhizobium sp. LSHC420B00]|nr:hypothetical protein X759_27255 [Mesorhizobium sp. LSHC420B00]